MNGLQMFPRYQPNFGTSIRFAMQRPGMTLTEVVVAFALLATLINTLLPTIIRHGRLRQSLRHERLALDELANQLEQLTMLDDQQIDIAIEHLEPSRIAQDSLANVQLVGSATQDDGGTRLRLEIAWDSPGRRQRPLMLTAWSYHTEHDAQSEDVGAPLDEAPTTSEPSATSQAGEQGGTQ